MVRLFQRTAFISAISVVFITAAGVFGADEPDEPTGVLTLPRALSLALLRSPELAEFGWELRASEARLVQARLLPNAEISLLAEDVLGTGSFDGVRQAQTTLEIGQLFELGGKRRARIDAASRSSDSAASEFEVKRADVLADVTRKFIEVLEHQDHRAVAEADVVLGRSSLEAVRRRIQAGAGSRIEEKKAQITLARSELAVEDETHETAVASHALAATWGASSVRFDVAEGDLYARRAVPPFDQLLERLRSAPELLRRGFETRLREANARVAETKAVPDVTLKAGIRRFEGPGEESFLFGFSLPLPFSDRNQGGRQEARALVSKSKAAEIKEQTQLRAALFRLHQELLHSGHRLESIEKEILPRAEESVVLSRRGFDSGGFSLLELLDAERTLVEVKKERIEAAASYHQFVLEIERLVGGPLGRPATGP